MEKKIRDIFEKTLKKHYINKMKCGLWISKGDTENSFVAISEDENIEYQLFFFYKNENVLTKKEIKTLLHEISHIIILEEIIRKQGNDRMREELEKYEIEKEKINLLEKEEQQKKYKEIYFEKEANRLADAIFNKMKEEGEIWKKK